jgi:PAS domain S-box-containing protein
LRPTRELTAKLAQSRPAGGADAGARRFELFASVAPVGMFQSDAQGRCVFVNERWCHLAGLAAGEALADGWTAALHPDDCARVRAGWRQAVGRREPFLAEHRFQRPDGSVTWVLSQMQPDLDASGSSRNCRTRWRR